MKSIPYLSLFAALLLSSSCATYKRCAEKFPPQRDSVRVVEVRDSIILKDTTIYITIKGETKHDSVFINVPTPKPIYSDTLTQETDLATAKAWIEASYLMLELTQKDTTIIRRLDGAIKEAFYWRSEYEKVTQIPRAEKYIPKIYKVTFWICLLSAVVGILLLLRKFKIIKF